MLSLYTEMIIEFIACSCTTVVYLLHFVGLGKAYALAFGARGAKVVGKH